MEEKLKLKWVLKFRAPVVLKSAAISHTSNSIQKITTSFRNHGFAVVNLPNGYQAFVGHVIAGM